MNLVKKFGLKALAVGVCVASLSLTAFAAGWGQQNGKYYFVDPKTEQKVSGKWIHTSSGYYYIGADTYMVTGWKKLNNAWHYFRPYPSSNRFPYCRWKRKGNNNLRLSSTIRSA